MSCKMVEVIASTLTAPHSKERGLHCEDLMQNAGRWKSPQMPVRYARAKEAERGVVARFKEKKGR